ncbi:MAG TPA: UbiX family flavin prenyltransferase [bacterium]|jgi:4-hydroxy-3-polyprenylbenzoate decarboxylase|nr:UbiX family flavin prenyltransferase [bacterium]
MKKILIAVSGASGTIYARRFFQHFPYDDWEVHAVVSSSARIVASHEGGLNLPPHVKEWDEKDLAAPPASGSNKFEAMVVIPCSTTTLGKLAHGIADNLITRSGEVFLKERRELILVPRETPLSLIQIKNMELLTLAGAHIIPATPSFYGNPKTLEDVVDTVIARVYDHAGIQAEVSKRWRSEEEKRQKIRD